MNDAYSLHMINIQKRQLSDNENQLRALDNRIGAMENILTQMQERLTFLTTAVESVDRSINQLASKEANDVEMLKNNTSALGKQLGESIAALEAQEERHISLVDAQLEEMYKILSSDSGLGVTVQANTVQIASLESELSTLSERVSTNELTIRTQKDEISTNLKSIGVLEQQHNDTIGRMTSLNETLTATTTRVEELVRLIDNTSTHADNLETRVVSLEDNVQSIPDQIRTNSATISNLSRDLDSLQSQTSAINDNVDSLSTTTNNLSTSLDSLQSQMSAINNNMGSLSITTNNLSTSLNSLQSQTSTINNNVGSLSTMTNKLSMSLNSLRNQTSAINDNVGNLSTTVSQLDSDSQTHSRSITNLQISVNNLNPKISSITQMLNTMKTTFTMKSWVPSQTTDGNGFIRLSMSSLPDDAAGKSNDYIVSIQPYDCRVTSYSCAFVAWTDYSGDGDINVCLKWANANSIAALGSGNRIKVWYWAKNPASSMVV